jgi:hypothetical protein
MRIHEYIEAVRLGYTQNLDRVLNKVFVIDARASGLDGLPGEYITDRVESISLESCKMCRGVVLCKWALVEGDIVAVEEMIAYVRRDVGFAWELGIRRDVDAAEDNLSACSIAKLSILYGQPERHVDDLVPILL